MINVGLLSHYSLVGTCDGHCVGAVAPCSPEPFLQHWILHFAIGIGTALIFCHIVPPIHPICAWYSPIIVVPCILHFVVCWLGTIVGCPKNLGIPDITFQTESHLSMIFALGPTFSLFLGAGLLDYMSVCDLVGRRTDDKKQLKRLCRTRTSTVLLL